MTTAERIYLNKAARTWQEAYPITLKNKKAMQARLKDLETWDNCNHHELERQAKIIALTNLINKTT